MIRERQMLVADRYVRLCGVGSNEITSTDVSADDYSLTIKAQPKGSEVYIAIRIRTARPVDKCDSVRTAAQTKGSVQKQLSDLKAT